MNKNTILLNTIKIIGALIIISLVIIFVIYNSALSTVSPDSIRFMHFWQINADHFITDGGHFLSAVKAVYYSLKSSTNYDLGRGRFIQYIFYGFDGLLRWQLPLPMINFLMILLLTLNSALIAWVSTSSIKDITVRLNLFCLGWVIIMSSAFVISPVMLLTLYAKYLWLTFILAFFIASRKSLKTVFLIGAASSDEIGLFAVMIITTLSIMRWGLNYDYGKSKFEQTPIFRIARALLYGIGASLSVFFVFYGISAVFLRESPRCFLGQIFRIGNNVVHGVSLGEKFFGMLFRSEMLILGLSFGYSFITIIVGLAVLIVIIIGIWKRRSMIFELKKCVHFRMDGMIYIWLSDKRGFFYTFWIIMLLMLTVVFAPGHAGKIIHYSYPAAVVLAILLIMAFQDIWSTRHVTIMLIAILAMHLILLPQTITITSNGLESHLFPDKTVTKEDINAIKKCVLELREKGNSIFFETFNNCQEIDFSGTWYYSKIKGYGRAANSPYFPIEGTVRVLLWPDKINTGCNDRVFDYKTPSFKDND